MSFLSSCRRPITPDSGALAQSVCGRASTDRAVEQCNNLATQTLDPMGYSPTTTGNGTSGTPGGGCTALGYNAIVKFLTNIGLGNDYPRAQLSHHIVTSKCIDVEGDHATMTAYWIGLTGPTPPSTTTTVSDGGQYDNTYVKVRGVWKADQNRVIFDSNIVDYPCLN